jgi:hypothetical protein
MPFVIKIHSNYNPGSVYSDLKNREEYDNLFSNKAGNMATSALESLVSSVKEVGQAFIDMLAADLTSDPGKVGELQRIGTTYAAGFQACLGLAKACTGDIYSGVYNCLLGALGVSCSRPGKSREMLKTYVVITFINGCVQAMEVVQIVLLGIPMFGHGMPFVVTAGHVITLLNPVAAFMGAYIGWQCVKAAKHQYMLTLAQYHIQMLMMQQHQQMVQTAGQQQGVKRLPAIEEVPEEDESIIECTGGSQSAAV